MRYHFRERPAEGFKAEVVRAPVLSDREETIRERVQLARECVAHNLALAPEKQLREVDGASEEAPVGLVDPGLPRRIDEKPVHQVREVVTRRSRDGPVVGQVLFVGQYLLDQRVDWFSRRPEDSVVQAIEVGGGIP